MPLPKTCCLEPLIIPGEPHGNLEHYDRAEKRIKWYRASPRTSNGGSNQDQALVLFYDVFGFNLPNSKILADQFADKLGVDVYVPNYLPNPPHIEPFLPILDLYPHQQALTGLTKWKRLARTAWAFLTSLPYLIRVLDWWAYPRAKQAIEELSSKYQKLGVIGYCRGGAIVIRMLSEQVKPISCGIINHPGPINMREWKSINVPSKWNLADEDDYMKDNEIGELVKLSKEKADQGVTMEYMVFPETTHGFASRPNTGHRPSKEAFDTVNHEVITFFGTHLLG